MFHKMRRTKQLLNENEAITLLKKATSGTLSLIDESGYPYGIPLSYVYDNHKIYFHSAKQGHKIDCINYNNKVSFTIIVEDHVVSKELTTYFKSVIVFGKVRLLESGDEFKEGMMKLSEKYAPDLEKEKILKEFNTLKNAMVVGIIDIEHITGKEAIELTRQRAQID